MQFGSIEAIFNAFRSLKVLIIGDVMIDVYTWGSVSRISPEAPIPIVQTTKRERRLGGAGNVALNVQALGASPLLCTVIGNDIEGNYCYELMYNTDMAVAGIIKSDERPTITKERVLAGSQHMLRIDAETIEPLTSKEEQSFIQLIKKQILQTDVVIFEDYDKGCITPRVIEAVTHYAHEKHIPIVVDPKKRNFFSYPNVTLFKPNLRELNEGLNLDLEAKDKETLSRVVRDLRKRLKIETALITLSENGLYVANEQESHFMPAHKRDIGDVSGAGDTIVSIAALALALNLPIQLTAALANLGGGLVCEHLGVVAIDKMQLMKEALAHNIPTLINDVAK